MSTDFWGTEKPKLIYEWCFFKISHTIGSFLLLQIESQSYTTRSWIQSLWEMRGLIWGTLILVGIFLRLWSHSFTLQNSGVQTWTWIRITGELIKCRFLDFNPQCLIHRSEMGQCFCFFNKWCQWCWDHTSRITALQRQAIPQLKRLPNYKFLWVS